MYPSQNNFIKDKNENIDNFEKKLRMNAYAVYPFKNNEDYNIKTIKPVENNDFFYNQQPNYNTCMKINNSKSAYERYYKPSLKINQKKILFQ